MSTVRHARVEIPRTPTEVLLKLTLVAFQHNISRDILSSGAFIPIIFHPSFSNLHFTPLMSFPSTPLVIIVNMPGASMLDRTGNFTRLSSSNIIGPTKTSRVTRRGPRNTTARVGTTPRAEIPASGGQPAGAQQRRRSVSTTHKTLRGPKGKTSSTKAVMEETVEYPIPLARGDQPLFPQQRPHPANIP